MTLKQYGRDCFIFNDPCEADYQKARDGLEEVGRILHSGEYQVIILDEVNIATFYGLFSVDRLLEIIRNKPEDVELILTGRKADPRIIEAGPGHGHAEHQALLSAGGPGQSRDRKIRLKHGDLLQYVYPIITNR